MGKGLDVAWRLTSLASICGDFATSVVSLVRKKAAFYMNLGCLKLFGNDDKEKG